MFHSLPPQGWKVPVAAPPPRPSPGPAGAWPVRPARTCPALTGKFHKQQILSCSLPLFRPPPTSRATDGIRKTQMLLRALLTRRKKEVHRNRLSDAAAQSAFENSRRRGVGVWPKPWSAAVPAAASPNLSEGHDRFQAFSHACGYCDWDSRDPKPRRALEQLLTIPVTALRRRRGFRYSSLAASIRPR